MDMTEWISRCAARYMELGGLTQEEANEAAGVCFVEDKDGDFEETPEEAADEDMLYWTDDGE